MVLAVCWLSLRLLDVLAELSLERLERVHRSADTALVRLINRLSKAAIVIVAVWFFSILRMSISLPRSPGWASVASPLASAPRKRLRTCSGASW